MTIEDIQGDYRASLARRRPVRRWLLFGVGVLIGLAITAVAAHYLLRGLYP